MKRLLQISTSHFIIACIAMWMLAWGCDFIQRRFWTDARTLAHILDYSGLGLFWGSISLLCVLVILGPFRPYNEFSMHGDCTRRAFNFLFALSTLATICIVTAIQIVDKLF